MMIDIGRGYGGSESEARKLEGEVVHLPGLADWLRWLVTDSVQAVAYLSWV